MQEGMRDRNGERLQGLRELMDKLRQQRQDRLDQFDLGGVYNEIADELNDIVDEERHAVDNATQAAERSGDERRGADRARFGGGSQLPARHVARRPRRQGARAAGVRLRVGRGRAALRATARQDSPAADAADGRADVGRDAEHDARGHAAHEGHDRRRSTRCSSGSERGEDPQFEKFMEEFGDFFPENPQTLDELLEQMAQRMAAMQAMMNSMTPEQRAQLQQLSDQLLEDMDLRWQMDQLGQNLQSMFPQMGWGQGYEFEGSDPMGMGQAMQTMQELGDLDQLENLLRNATSPGALAEADMDRVRDLMGDDAARSLERLAELTKMLQDAGLIEQKEGRLELTPKGLRKIGSNALRDLFDKLAKDKVGQHQMDRLGQGHERTYETKQYEYGDPFNLDLHKHHPQRAPPQRRRARRCGCRPTTSRSRRTEHITKSSTVLMLDLSLSACRCATTSCRPRRSRWRCTRSSRRSSHATTWASSGSARRRASSPPRNCPKVSWDFVYGTNMQHGFVLARQLLSKQTGTKQIIMITDGEPTAHITHSGDVFFNYPPVQETVEATLREVVRCTQGQHPHQHVHARCQQLPEVVHREADVDQPRSRVLHDARDARRLRAGRLHRDTRSSWPAAEVPAAPAEPAAEFGGDAGTERPSRGSHVVSPSFANCVRHCGPRSGAPGY